MAREFWLILARQVVMIAACACVAACRSGPSLGDELLPFLDGYVDSGVVALGVIGRVDGGVPILIKVIDEAGKVRLVFVVRRPADGISSARSVRVSAEEGDSVRLLLLGAAAQGELPPLPEGVMMRLWLIESGKEVHSSFSGDRGRPGADILFREVATSIQWASRYVPR